MTLRIPALYDEACPKCGASNDPKRATVWQVADERGVHFECDCCAHAWKAPESYQG